MPSTLLGYNSKVEANAQSETLKVTLYADPHFISTSIRSRIDDYPINSLNKVTFVLWHAKNNGFELILCGGDLFHSSSMENVAQGGYRAGVFFVLGSISISYYSIVGNIPVLLLLPIWLFVNDWFLITRQCPYLRRKQV
jgi:hypothetical protein